MPGAFIRGVSALRSAFSIDENRTYGSDPCSRGRTRPSARFSAFFPHTSLGSGFLRAFYRHYCRESAAISFVALSDAGEVMGFVVGSMSSKGFFRGLLTREFFPLALGAVMTAARNPRHVLRLMRGIFYRDEAFVAEGDALLSSLAVSPEAQGQGVGGALLCAWVSEARQRGAASAYVTTDALNNDAANRFYTRSGWTLTKQKTTREGRVMNVYTFSVASP